MVVFQKWAKPFAIGWLLFISVLFFLPGSDLPSAGLFSLPYLDKCIHFGFFGVLLFSWRFYFGSERRFYWLLLVLAFLYGMLVEVIQHYFIPNRSFDLLDVLADMLGAGFGLWVWSRLPIKK